VDPRKSRALGEDGAIRAWSVADGRKPWALEGRPAESSALAFSPDGSRPTLVRGDGQVLVLVLVLVLEAEGGRMAAVLPGGTPTGRWGFVDGGRTLAGRSRER